MFSLLLITYDFPYGQGETFLETEIKYASQHFPIVYILSTSRNKNLTRELPSNVKAFKIDRCYHFIGCLLYSISKCFSQEARNEFRDVKHLRNKPNKLKMIKSWIITWMIEKRLAIAIKELHFDLHNIIGYSYWLSASAYYLSKETNLPVHIAEEAICCVAMGTGKALNEMSVISRTRNKGARRVL